MLVYLRSAIALFIFANFLYLTATVVDPDLGWHLRTGEWILAHHGVPRLDEYSHTMAGTRWVDHEWAIDAALWWMRVHELWWLVVGVFTALALTPFLVWIRRARDPLMVWAVLLMAFLFTRMLAVRPQLISFFFFFVAYELLALNSSNQGRRVYLGFFVLPLVFFLWANLHAGFVSGLILWLLWAGGSFLKRYRKRLRLARRELFFNGVSFLVAAGATLVNPYGVDLYREIWATLTSLRTAVYIAEWQPALTVFGVGSLMWLLLGVFIFLLTRYYRRYLLPEFFAGAFFFFAFIKSARMAPFFFVTAAPLLAHGLGYGAEEIAAARGDKPFTPRGRQVFVALCAFLFVSVLGTFSYSLITSEPYRLPEKAVLFLRKYARTSGPVTLFNEYGWGGYLVNEAPELRVFIDGRMPHWVDGEGKSAMAEYIDVFYGKDPSAWQEIFHRRSITAVLMRNDGSGGYIKPGAYAALRHRFWSRFFAQTPGRDLKAALREQNWIALYEDDVAVLLVCPNCVLPQELTKTQRTGVYLNAVACVVLPPSPRPPPKFSSPETPAPDLYKDESLLTKERRLFLLENLGGGYKRTYIV